MLQPKPVNIVYHDGTFKQEKEKTLNVGVKIRTQREKKKTERAAENFMPYFHIL